MEPITREEVYMAVAAGQAADLPEPITRKEKFLAKAAGMDVKVPEPITREEMYLSRISGGESSGGGNGGGEKVLYMDAALLNAGGAYPVDADDYTTAVIPAEATFVDVEAFANLPNLDTLIVNGDCEFETYGEYDSSTKTTHYVNAMTGKRIPIRKLTIQNRTVGLPDEFMYYAGPLIEVAVSGSLGVSCFNRCTYLQKATLEKCESIGTYAFYCCNGLTECTILDGATSIGHAAFYECSRLAKLTLPDSVIDIGENAFYGCSGLTEIKLSSGLTNIAPYTFRGCTALTEITIPANIANIGGYAFYSCTNLATITILGAETTIGSTSSIPSTTTIRGYAGSAAETFATENGYTFEVIA